MLTELEIVSAGDWPRQRERTGPVGLLARPLHPAQGRSIPRGQSDGDGSRRRRQPPVASQSAGGNACSAGRAHLPRPPEGHHPHHRWSSLVELSSCVNSTCPVFRCSTGRHCVHLTLRLVAPSCSSLMRCMSPAMQASTGTRSKSAAGLWSGRCRLTCTSVRPCFIPSFRTQYLPPPGTSNEV